MLLLLTADIHHNPAVIHHNQAVAVGNGIAHIVGDHQSGQVILCHNFLGHIQHLGCGLGVKGRGMLVQQQQFGLLEGSHQQSQCLTLSAGKQTHFGGHSVLQTQIQNLELFSVRFPLRLGDTGSEGSGLTPAGCQCQIFLNPHIGSRAHHGILEYTADILGTLILRQTGDINPVNGDPAFVHTVNTGHGVHQCGLTGTIAADDRHKVTGVQMQAHTPQGYFLIDRACIKGLYNILNIKHCGPPSAFRHGLSLLSSWEPSGRSPRSKQRTVSDSWYRCAAR